MAGVRIQAWHFFLPVSICDVTLIRGLGTNTPQKHVLVTLCKTRLCAKSESQILNAELSFKHLDLNNLVNAFMMLLNNCYFTMGILMHLILSKW